MTHLGLILSRPEVKRLLRWTSLMIQKSIEMVGLVLPRSTLREGEATIKPDDQVRALFV